MKSLGIAIEGGRFVRIDSRTVDPPKNVRLRTLDGKQNAAKLDFYAFRGGKRVLRKTVKLEGLASPDGIPAELRLRAERLSSSSWEVRVRKPDGRSEIIRVRTGFGGTVWIVAAVLLILLASAAFFFIPRVGTGNPESGFGRGGTEAAAGSSDGDGTDAEDLGSSAEGTAGADAGASGDAGDDGAGIDGDSGDDGAEDSRLAEDGERHASPGDDTDAAASAADTAGERISAGGSADGVEEKAEEKRLPDLPTSEVVYFEPESAELSRRTKAILDDFLDDLPEGAVVEVGGHCANFGTERGRTILSEARADAVAAYLGDRADPSVRIEAVGYGVTRPATNDPQRQDLNRRVELRTRWD